MTRIRDPQRLISQGAIDLLHGLEPHLPVSLAELCARLQAGLPPAQAGDELSNLLAAYWQPLLDELNHSVQSWRMQAESYRMSWETCRNAPINEHLAEAKAKLTELEKRLKEYEQQLAAHSQRQRNMEQENERLATLLDDQQVIIAEQQLQLAQMDESSFDV